MSRIDTSRLAIAAAGVTGIAYIVCAAFVAVAPGAAVRLLGWLVHVMDIEDLADVGVTAGGFFLGLLEAVAYAYLFVLAVGFAYNRLGRTPA